MVLPERRKLHAVPLSSLLFIFRRNIVRPVFSVTRIFSPALCQFCLRTVDCSGENIRSKSSSGQVEGSSDNAPEKILTENPKNNRKFSKFFKIVFRSLIAPLAGRMQFRQHQPKILRSVLSLLVCQFCVTFFTLVTSRSS